MQGRFAGNGSRGCYSASQRHAFAIRFAAVSKGNHVVDTAMRGPPFARPQQRPMFYSGNQESSVAIFISKPILKLDRFLRRNTLSIMELLARANIRNRLLSFQRGWRWIKSRKMQFKMAS
jgi:hypothetical protein